MSEQNCKRCGAQLALGGTLQGMCTTCLMELGLEEDSHVVITGAYEAPAPPPTPAELQPLFPNHVIEAVLGQGGMGVVYRAQQKGLERTVALKVLPAKAGRDPAFAERFAREARALASLNHPNITAVYDFGKAGEHYFLSMEFVDGVNLRQLLTAQKVAPKQALQIVEQICDALQYAHDEGVVHRDIKPENILLDRKGNLKITDFGLAKMLGREHENPTALTMTHQVMGTPHYMAPEQIEKPAEVDHRADIYSLGVVFYELLTGELPLGRFAPPSGKVKIDVKLDEVVLRALEKEPALRYQTASAVKSDVSNFGDRTQWSAGRAAAGRAAAHPSPAFAAGGASGAAGGAENGSARGKSKMSTFTKVVLFFLLLPLVMICGCMVLLPIGYRRVPVAESVVIAEVETRNIPPAPMAQSGLERLEGLDFFEKKANGKLQLSLAFREVFKVREEVATDLADLMDTLHREYRHKREELTSHDVTGPLEGRVTIEGFPEYDEFLVNGFLRNSRALLSPEAFEAMIARDPIHTEIVEDGRQDIVHSLRYAAGVYYWQTFVDGVIHEQGESHELPEHLNQLWQAMFLPLGPSICGALDSLITQVEALESDERTIELSSIRSDPPGGRRIRRADEDVTMLVIDAYFLAPTIEEAAQLLELFKQACEAQSGVTVQIDRTDSITNVATRGTGPNSGLSVNKMEIRFPTDNPPVALPTKGKELTGYLRSLAHASEGIGEVDIKMSSGDFRNGSAKLREKKYSVLTSLPNPDAPRTLRQVAAWCKKIEDGDELSVVNRLVLLNKGQGWTASVYVMTRESR